MPKLAMLQGKRGARFAALLYHHVGPRQSHTNPEMTVSPEAFERQLKWWAGQGYAGITPSQWVAWRNDAVPLPEQKVVMFTFDDAYAELETYALPMLQRYGFAAAIYCVTNRLGANNDWDRDMGFDGHRLMTADRIRYWSSCGFEIGSHTRTHPDLRTLSGTQLEDEIAGSAADLTDVLGKPPVSFAYPYGHFDLRVRGVVEAHYRTALSVEEGTNTIDTDPYCLRRIGVRPGDWRVDPACIAIFGFSARHEFRKIVGRAVRRFGWVSGVQKG